MKEWVNSWRYSWANCTPLLIHRSIKQRYYPMHGFGTVEAAARISCAFDELRSYLRPRRTMGEVVSLREQRQTFLKLLVALQTWIQAAS